MKIISDYGEFDDEMFDDETFDGCVISLEDFPKRKLTKHEQEHLVRIETLARIYEQADRVITGDPVTVSVEPTGPAPAWSDGKSISFNADQITEFDIEELTQLNGLNYHELAHHEFTPRRSSKLVDWVLNNNLMNSFNMLEDQRIENLMVGRFPSVIPYLQATIARWLASSPQDLMVNYACIRGRRYLPLEVREAFRDNFIDPSLIPAIADIVDQYRVLALPEDDAIAMDLIQRFQDEVLSKLPRTPTGGGPGGCGHRPPTTSGRPTRAKQQRKDLQRAKRYDGKADDVPTQTKPDDVKLDQDNALDLRNETAKEPQEFSLKPGQGHFESVGGIPEDLNKVLQRTIADALSRKDVQADVKSKQRAILGGDGKHDYQIKRGKYDETPAPLNVIQIARKFQIELEKLRSDAEPTWILETPSGRLNINRVIRGADFDTAFDLWEEGNDSTDMEVVILIDRSGSMSSNENDRLASQACWVIKRSLEAIEAPVTVLSFDDKGELVYGREDKSHRNQYKFIYGQGGTDPRDVLLEAERVLLASRKRSKILLLITDGAFHSDESDKAIQRMASRGVLTSMVLLDVPYRSDSSVDYNAMFHGTEIKARLDSAAGLIPFARALVVGAIKKRAQNR